MASVGTGVREGLVAGKRDMYSWVYYIIVVKRHGVILYPLGKAVLRAPTVVSGMSRGLFRTGE